MVKKPKNELKKDFTRPDEPDEAAALAVGQPSFEEEPNIAVFRPDREGVRKVMGDLEADIMEYIWIKVPTGTSAGVTVREVYEAFWQSRYTAYTTIMTTMARLARKHLLRARKVDTAFVYTPILNKEQFIDNFVSRILENLLVSFSKPTEAHLERLARNPENADRIASLKSRVAALREKSGEVFSGDNSGKAAERQGEPEEA
ncbi:MAG: BlaI/MecI/CopY family transcriptional regulator [Chloroflexi bacterium]|nr:BlaI/MecI/CopY family transcriptional regulator [Chloroflexota bacterium]OJW04124.1 MAG: hypothetical protein BGO39_06450 [Chloroflexi bacterium 54-19]